MKISSESELMKNHKHAEIMSPDAVFSAVQTSEGHSLLFSIGTDAVFYLVKETLTDVNGWVKTDLSSGLSGSKVTAKTFDVSLNHATGNIDIALAVTIDGKDTLYLSLNNSNADAVWSAPLTWQAVPSDDAQYPAVVIADVYLSQGRSAEYIVVDILKDPSNSLNIVFRFFIDPEKKLGGKAWHRHDLAADLQAGSITSLIGRREKDRIDGIYTLGSIVGTEELIFTPLYNIFNQAVPPEPSTLVMPPLASAMALATIADNTTNLFVAGDKALYFFPSSVQKDGNAGQKIVDNPIFAGVQKLYADVVNQQVFVWGLNQAGDIFYLECPLGQETVSTAWSYPVPLLDGVEQITPYANVQTGHSVIFAHISGDELVQLTQDPYTATWQQRKILLPTTDVNDVIEYNSFSTHVNVANDNGASFGKAITLSVTSKSPVGIYVNNAYHKLSPDVATNIDTDVTGALTIIQETQVLSAVCYHVVNTDSGVAIDINPMNKMVDKVSKIQSGDDLGNVQVDNGDGTKKALLPADTLQPQKDATASALQQFVTISATLPADGSKKVASPQLMSAAAVKFVPQAHNIWGISYSGDSWSYHEGQDAMNRFGLAVNTSTNRLAFAAANTAGVGDVLDDIESVAEDIFNWLKKAWQAVTHFFVTLAEDIYHLCIEIGGQIYKFMVDCISVVVKAVEFVFNKIKVFFEDLIKWLGFLFSWSDIVRTHNVVKNVLKQYAGYCVGNIDNFKSQVAEAFQNLEANINSWAGLPAPTLTANDLTSQGSADNGQNSPQARYGIYHTQHNVGNATAQAFPADPDGASILTDLLNMVNQEGQAFQTAYQNIKDIIDNLSTLSLLDIIKKIIAILVDLILTTMENIVTTLLQIVEDIIKGVMDLLDASIDIPVISWLYKKISGNDLSILDLVCLVVAIPSTLIYKIAKNEAPFPDNSVSTSLINAPDFATIQKICSAPSPSPAMLKSGRASGGPSPLDPETAAIYASLAFSANCMAFGGAILLSIVNGIKTYVLPDSGLISFVAGVLYLPYVAPDIMGTIPQLLDKKWYVVMNETVTGICTAKALVDICGYKKTPGFVTGWNKASPFIESAMNLIWQVPTTAAICYQENQNLNGMLGFFGGSLFDAGGIIAPIVADDPEKISQAVAFAASVICNVGYGSACLATNFIPSNE